VVAFLLAAGQQHEHGAALAHASPRREARS
jgi:hypothetical protein